MIRAFHTAASGLVAQTVKQDIIANNIANAQTPGFKRQRVVAMSFAQALEQQAASLKFRERPPYPDSPARTPIVSAGEAVDPTQGHIRETGNRLEFALEGEGAFEISTPQGIRHTRNGRFQVNTAGELCTADGAKVQGQSGTIYVPQGEWSVGKDGTITTETGPVDKIRIVGSTNGNTSVLQGYLEESNLNIVSEMVQMIANMRSYEANQKVVSSVDQTLDKLINEAGRV